MTRPGHIRFLQLHERNAHYLGHTPDCLRSSKRPAASRQGGRGDDDDDCNEADESDESEEYEGEMEEEAEEEEEEEAKPLPTISRLVKNIGRAGLRSEGRRVGKGGWGWCRARWAG